VQKNAHKPFQWLLPVGAQNKKSMQFQFLIAIGTRFAFISAIPPQILKTMN
jgi:hypothetical protein